MTQATKSVRFEELALNDPNLGQEFLLCLYDLHLAGGGIHGGIDNLIQVLQSNVTVNHLTFGLLGYTPTLQDNTLYIQPILQHLIRSRTQLRKVSVSWLLMPSPATLALRELLFQIMEAATQNPLIEELALSEGTLPVSHFTRLFNMNRNIKRLELQSGCIVTGVVATTNVAAIAVSNDNVNVLQMLSISGGTKFTEEAASEFLQVLQHPSDRNIAELELGHIEFDNDSAVAPAFLRALVGKSTIKRVKLPMNCRPNHFKSIARAATNVEALSVVIHPDNVKEKMLTLTRTLPKLKHLLELNLTCVSPRWRNAICAVSKEARNKFVRFVEQHTNLTTVTLRDLRNFCFSPAQQHTLRTCGNRNVMLRELLTSAGNEDEPAPPQVPRFLTTCHNCPNAALAILMALKDKVGPPGSQKRKSACLKQKKIE